MSESLYNQPCPVNKDEFGERSGSGVSLEEFREIAERHYRGGSIPPRQLISDRDPGEYFVPSTSVSPLRLRVGRGGAELLRAPCWIREATDPQRITVNKTTHRIRFENETELSVDVVIEAKEPREQP